MNSGLWIRLRAVASGEGTEGRIGVVRPEEAREVTMSEDLDKA